MLGPMLAALIVALVSAAPALPPPPPPTVATVPDEPSSIVLPHSGPTLQALAADLDGDGDGAPELVRLVGAERDGVVAEAWRDTAAGWVALGALVIVPGQPSGDRADGDYIGRPVRLLLRHVDGDDRVTLVRQPRHAEPGIGAEDCCLLVDDLVIRAGALALVPVADPAGSVDAVFAIDLDGDETDELLTARSLPPLAGISYPTEALVYRWAGPAFGDPVTTELPVGSGDTPFILGDSDGLPGDELAILGTVGSPALFRISIGDGDLLRVERAGLAVTDARAVPIGGGRGIAVVGPVAGLAVMPWHRGAEPEEPIGSLAMDDARMVGIVEARGEPQLVVRGTDQESVHVLSLPGLVPSGEETVPTAVALTLAAGPVAPYAGILPGGGPDREPAVVAGGRLLGTGDVPAEATLAGAQPIGLVGRGRAWLAIQHGPTPFGPLHPAGGRLDAASRQADASLTLAPLSTALAREAGSGVLEPEVHRATTLADGTLGVSADGFVAIIEAPPGSRVYVAPSGSDALAPALVVPSRGELDVALTPSGAASGAETPGFRPALTVVTPAGDAYLASWDAVVLDGPPPLGATTHTPLGSADVEIRGSTAPYATVRLGGDSLAVDADGRFRTTVALPPWPTEIVVVAVDPIGNEARLRLTGIGLFDYRSLPWIPISAVLLGVAAVVLFLRVPRTRAAPRTASEEGTVEELEPD
jgi:hypothetical protein